MLALWKSETLLHAFLDGYSSLQPPLQNPNHWKSSVGSTLSYLPPYAPACILHVLHTKTTVPQILRRKPPSHRLLILMHPEGQVGREGQVGQSRSFVVADRLLAPIWVASLA